MIITVSCSHENDSKEVEEAINENYLKSESYQLFRKRSRFEYDRSATKKKNFGEFVENKIISNDWKQLSIPAVINQQLITSSLGHDPKRRGSLTTILGRQQIYHSLANVRLEDHKYYFFMTCKVASYKDCLIWFASVSEQTLVQIEKLTIYLRTLSYSEVPVISVRQSSITVDVNRKVDYPITSSNRYTLRYKIRDNGKIYRVEHN